MVLEQKVFHSLEEAIEDWGNREPISQKEIINGQLKTILFFDVEKPLLSPDWCGKDEYWRHVTGILVEDGNSKLDLCSLAPDGTRFETDHACSGNPRFESLIPTAQTAFAKDTIIVILNPDIYKLRGGNLWTLHEIGHAWRIHDGRLENSGEARKLLCNFSRKGKNKATREKLLAALELLNQTENDAWQFSLDKYKEIKFGGFDLAPLLSGEEIEVYPQIVYDELYNREIWRAAEAVGREKALVWRKNDF